MLRVPPELPEKMEPRAKIEYMNNAIMRTQSMYNFEDRVGMLQSKEVGAVAPFQSFAFEMMNWLRELGLVDFDAMRNVPVIGKQLAKPLDNRHATQQPRERRLPLQPVQNTKRVVRLRPPNTRHRRPARIPAEFDRRRIIQHPTLAHLAID